MSAATESRKRSAASWSGQATGAVPAFQRVGALFALAVGSVALVALALYLVIAVNWAQRPFPGYMLTRTLVVDGSQPVSAGTWPGLAAGLQRGDQIVGIDGHYLTGLDSSAAYETYQQVATGLRVGQPTTITFERAVPGSMTSEAGSVCDVTNGVATCSVAVTPISFPGGDFAAQFMIPLASGAILIVIGLALLRLRRQDPAALVTASLCFAQAIFAAGFFDQNTTHELIPLWIVATAVMGGGLGLLAFLFPTRSPRLYGRPVLVYLPVFGAVAAALVLLYLSVNPPSPGAVLNVYAGAVAVALIGLAILTIRLIYSRGRAMSTGVRDQSTTVLVGIALACAPLIVWIINLLIRPLLGYDALTLNARAAMPFFILPALSLVYAIFEYRVPNTDKLVSQAISYSLMLLSLMVGYFLLVFGATLVISRVIAANDVPLMAIVIFAVALLFLPLRARLQERIDALYFRTRRNYQTEIETAAQKLPMLVSVEDITAEYRARLEDVLTPTSIFTFLRNAETGEYAALDSAATDVRFASDSPLVDLVNREEFVYLEPGVSWPSELLAERARLMILRGLVIVGLRGSQQLNGFTLIGPPRSGAAVYTYEALRFVRNLTQQIGVALERAQVVSSLESRVRELDVLSQVSQAVNFTMEFDDLLELISSQADKLIQSTHFYIVLRDSNSDDLYYAFFLERDERYKEKENRRWPQGRDLFSEVIRNSQPLRTADYAAALAERDVKPRSEDPKLKAWMGVPLTAGPRTIGLLAAGATQPDKVFTDDQLKIFTDIAALAATSIDKARLFDETNQRARQLAALNDISRQLVAVELNLEKLLALITSNAVDILNAEAGALLLTTDDDTGNLEYRVVTGYARQDLVGARRPAHGGHLGQVATTGAPVIVNNALQDPRYLGTGTLTMSGLRAQTLIAVPLITQSRVIGVLEIRNKKGGGIFTQDDASLLTTFAGQAAVAIENARLFQMTDYQLSQRVAELEAMERIDVQLNQSLDAVKVAEITVGYAREYSGATAGLLALIVADEGRMRIIAIQGYAPDEMPPGGTMKSWPIGQGIVSRVIRTRRAELVTDVTIDPDYVPSLHGTISQMTVPMLSAGSVSAVLVLETNKVPRFSLAHLAFVQRLAEHASIAFANAQLYAELDRANQSKSEFVSFVAHELKNPLTSIKGYTDVMEKAGVLSDMQKNFLGTIRSNADRMNTLVSDLNDVTKLQTNNMRIDPSSISIYAVLKETLGPLEQQMDEKGQTLDIEVPPNLPMIYADHNRMVQVLTNLVSNAHKYTPENGTVKVAASMSRGRSQATGRLTPPTLHVSVSDTGIGMSSDDLKRLFTPYFRSDNPLAREQPGTGLGLTISRGLIERHGGEIWVESEVGKGTTFHFTVPIAMPGQL